MERAFLQPPILNYNKSRSVFEGYNIVDRADVEQAMEKLAEFHQDEDFNLERTLTRPI